jgi:hypothetical protein
MQRTIRRDTTIASVGASHDHEIVETEQQTLKFFIQKRSKLPEDDDVDNESFTEFVHDVVPIDDAEVLLVVL